MTDRITWASYAVLRVQVFLCARSQQDVDAALARFKEQGYTVAGMAADVAQKEQREQLVQQVRCCVRPCFGVDSHL
jgi:short-subunit dehydrogenase involved in D-alanine esterification of teichoic acids